MMRLFMVDVENVPHAVDILRIVSLKRKIIWHYFSIIHMQIEYVKSLDT